MHSERDRVPGIAFNVYKSKFREPTEDEGYTEVARIDFVPTFKDDKTKALFLQFTGGE